MDAFLLILAMTVGIIVVIALGAFAGAAEGAHPLVRVAAGVLALVIFSGGLAVLTRQGDDRPCARYETRLMPVGKTLMPMRTCVQHWEPVP